MRLSVHLALWTRDWADDVLPYARKAKEIGYDGVEISLLGAAADDPGRVGAALADLGLGVTVTTGLSRADDIASIDDDIRARGIAAVERAIRTTHALGSELLSGVIYSSWGTVDGPNRAARLDRAAAGLRAVARLAELLGVRLGLEAINRYETDILNTAESAVALADAIGSQSVGVLLDSFHMNIEEVDPAKAIETTGKRLFHYHCVDNDRGAPGGGKIDFASQAEALRSISYQGWVTTEMFILPDVRVSPDLSVWRPIEPNPDTAARDALRYLRETFS